LFERVAEVPFDSDRKRMTTVHRVGGDAGEMPAQLQQALSCLAQTPPEYIAFTKGAVESLLDISCRVWAQDHPEPMDEAWRERIRVASDELAQQGMRVMGVCVRPLDSAQDKAEDDLIFIGMFGIIDPPRPEVRDAVARCRAAGIRPLMITGDHPLTAAYIARDLGIDDKGRVCTGAQLQTLDDAALDAMVQDVSVYARVAPQQKLRIVDALQRGQQIVAMTGDGVNDAPALKQADIGVAMGITGTDVAKEAADTVLLDDNFATVVNAVEEGRTIFANIRKFVTYTLTSNAGEVWVMLLAPFLGMPLPLLPLQILWVNLVTDGLPGLALAVEPGERNVMQRPPVPPGVGVLNRRIATDILWIGLLMGVVSLATGYLAWQPGSTGPASWQTMLFTVLTFSQMGNVLALRSSSDSLWQIGVFSNRPLIAAVALTFVLQLAVIYVPALQRIFYTVPLTAAELLVCLAVSSVVLCAVELRKYIDRRRHA
ncbi:MAG: cation-transporting P-type ATPase, partial [Halioglobus sp.]|nr:cation-transporting P-type ATPase [Halioglobus sp.]